MRTDSALSKNELLEIPVSTLAYVGDAVYELAVRRHILNRPGVPSGKLFKESVRYVEASAQARGMRGLFDELDGEEQALCKRARNHAPHSRPKHADPADYRQATALEALLGWLWLQGKDERLKWIVEKIFDRLEEEGEKAENPANTADESKIL